MRKKFKRLLPLVIAFAMLIGGQTVFANESTTNDLRSGYTEIANRARYYGIPFSMTFKDYVTAYDDSGFLTTREYADAYLGIMKSNAIPYSSSSSSGSGKWYYDTGTGLPSDANPKYDKYKLYDTVKRGDIIFEAKGGFGITAHVAIVEGKYKDARNINYIRVIEAINVGVVRSCLDDSRVDDKDMTLLRVTSATLPIIDSAVDFCIRQLGKPYSLDFGKHTSPDEPHWYCSELVWAAFKNLGIDIEVAGNGEPGITPRDIRNCDKVTSISFK